MYSFKKVSDLLHKYMEGINYLLVGGWNTLFGYLLYAGLFYIFHRNLNYIILLLISYFISILNNYLCYKFLVFKTRGNYIKEYCRFLVVYGASFLLNVALLPLFVEVFKIHPLVTQAIVTVFIVIISYFGHKKFSFHN